MDARGGKSVVVAEGVWATCVACDLLGGAGIGDSPFGSVLNKVVFVFAVGEPPS